MMTTAMPWWPSVAGALVLSLVETGVHLAQAQPGYPAASSQWGPGYGAAAAADAITHENSNYWQTVEGKDKDAWWQVDLGQVFPVKGVKVAWARYEDKYHCPPASAAVQVSVTGKEGSWEDVRKIAADEIPRDEEPYEPEREWSYPLKEATPARYVRLLFPEGDQPGAKYDGYLCLGEVEVQAPGLTPQVVTIEGPFGKAEVNVTYPALVQLYLRAPDGLNEQSLLAQAGRRPWAKHGCTYVVGEDQKRYESRLARPDRVELTEEGGRTVLRITGVKLSTGGDEQPVATEDWTLSAPGDGSQLIWSIVRRWEKDLTSVMSGSPGLFFSFDARQRENSVTSTIWYDPFRIAARPSELYALQDYPRRVSQNHIQTIRDRDTWAIYKLWTNWHAPSDLRLEVEGGQLYRRGSFAWLSEAGAVTAGDVTTTHSKGQVEEISLKIGGVDKYGTGYQLAITLPDKETESSLRDFYVSVLNGGAVNDQKGFDFGNESDGWYYAGSSWMYGMAVAAGAPAPGKLSSHPYDVARAFREHMAHILTRLDDQGRAHFGYNQGGQWVDDNLHTIIGTHAYLLHSGDLHFVRQNLPALERMLAYFIQRRNEQGLFKLDDVGAHWYYDAVSTSGINGYHNSFFYKATVDLAEMEAAAGRAEKAAEYREIAALIKKAFNEVLWKEDAPGGPRYLDWIDSQGQPVSYFCDLCQWPPIAVGIASPEQARKIVATADARIAQLEKEYGYQGYAGLSALWPVPESVNPLAKSWQTYGVYMNGGTLLCQTYWEIVARARAGDAKGAYHRLSRFAERAREISWAGDNAFTITGEPQGDGEPYLADMVAATAGVIHGVLGITPTWQQLDVKPCLPSGWSGAEAEVLYKGRRHRVTIEGDKVEIKPLEQVIELPLLWVMDWNLRDSPTGVAQASNLYFGDLSFVALKRVVDDQGALGLWKLDDEAGPVEDASPHQNHGIVTGEGVGRGQSGHGAAGKSFRFDGKGEVTVPDNENGSLASGPEESFTVQCWFNTEATDSRVMVGKPGAFCVYVKESKLAAWIMDIAGRFVEALGSRPVADGQWHHVAAVYDRRAQRLSIYLDGKLDTPEGTPGPRNPADISSLTDAAASQSLTLGGLGQNSFPYIGLLDEVSILRGALEPAAFSFKEDYPSPYGTAAVSYPQSGSYQSPPYDWTVAAKLTDLTVAAELNQGSVTATVETSDDEFKTVRSQVQIAVKDGMNTYPLDSFEGAARGVRVRLELAPGHQAAASPMVDGFRITATPAGTGP